MMKLGLFLHGPGQHIAAWRDPASDPGAGHEPAPLRASDAARRARAVRFRLQCRHPGHVRSRRRRGLEAQHGGAPHRADHAARRACRGDAAHRAGRNRDHDLSRAVPCGADVRVARPAQRGPRRLEPGHLVGAGRGAQLQPRRPRAARRPLRACRRVRPGGARSVGHLGGRRLRDGQGGRPVLRPEKLHMLNHKGKHFSVRGR